MPKKNKEILTTKDVAEYLHIHPLTVHKYAREGKIPAFKIGTDWRFHKKYIEKWIRQKVVCNVNGKKETKFVMEKS
jgi:excisionase family DNA binding protein